MAGQGTVMSIKSFGEWKYTVDRNATVEAYALASDGGADNCTCNGCRNFRLVRQRVFSPEFLSLLNELGIDPNKDGEVYHLCRTAPGRHMYGEWFHFVGKLHTTGDFPVIPMGGSLTAWMCYPGAPRLQSLDNLPCVQLEFYAEEVPWALDELEPE